MRTLVRATLLGCLLLVLLVGLIGTGAVELSGIGTALVPEPLRLRVEPLATTAPAPAPPTAVPAPGLGSEAAPASPAPAPQVIEAGELSVVAEGEPDPIVRYVDASGSIRMVRGLANVPAAHRGDAVVLGRRNVNLVDVPAPSAVAFQDWQPEANPNRHEVVLIGASWCAACERARRYLDRQGIRYDERDIDSDGAAREEVVRIMGRIAIPLLQVDGRYIAGFREDVYARVLK